jgi:hypothetical protein
VDSIAEVELKVNECKPLAAGNGVAKMYVGQGLTLIHFVAQLSHYVTESTRILAGT